MKRNLISVIILAFSIINFILLAIIVFTIIPTTKKTDNLITSISSIIDLNVDNKGGKESNKTIPLDQIYPYTIENEDQVTLKSDDGEAHYAVVQVTISMNMKSDDYKKYDPTSEDGIKAKSSIIETTVQDILSQYTAQECQNNKAQITSECKEAIKKLFDSDVIYDVSFKKYLIS